MARGSTRQWRKLADAQRAKRLACFICGQPINYEVGWPDPESFSADHIKPYAHFPALRYDPGNIASTHLRCNQAKGDSMHGAPGLGNLSEIF